MPNTSTILQRKTNRTRPSPVPGLGQGRLECIEPTPRLSVCKEADILTNQYLKMKFRIHRIRNMFRSENRFPENSVQPMVCSAGTLTLVGRFFCTAVLIQSDD